jgi:diphthine-ammonia ligase
VQVAALCSGGKDSTYAVYVAQQRGWDVARLVSILPEDPASMLYHVPNLHVVPLLAEAMGIPLVQEPSGTGEGAELEALRRALASLDVEGVVVGAIASDYQHSRVNEVAHDLGLRVFAPLWRKDQAALLRDYLDAGIQAIVTSVSAAGLGREWLGRTLDRAAAEELVRLSEGVGLSPCGEGGEFETLVTHAPGFSKRLEVVHAESKWHGSSGVFEISDARLVPA